MVESKKMNLYLISQTEVTGYDTYSDAVVAAKSAKRASAIHPRGNNEGWKEDVAPSWCSSPMLVKVEYLGKACKAQSRKEGVICASFRSG